MGYYKKIYARDQKHMRMLLILLTCSISCFLLITGCDDKSETNGEEISSNQLQNSDTNQFASESNYDTLSIDNTSYFIAKSLPDVFESSMQMIELVDIVGVSSGSLAVYSTSISNAENVESDLSFYFFDKSGTLIKTYSLDNLVSMSDFQFISIGKNPDQTYSIFGKLESSEKTQIWQYKFNVTGDLVESRQIYDKSKEEYIEKIFIDSYENLYICGMRDNNLYYCDILSKDLSFQFSIEDKIIEKKYRFNSRLICANERTFAVLFDVGEETQSFYLSEIDFENRELQTPQKLTHYGLPSDNELNLLSDGNLAYADGIYKIYDNSQTFNKILSWENISIDFNVYNTNLAFLDPETIFLTTQVKESEQIQKYTHYILEKTTQKPHEDKTELQIGMFKGTTEYDVAIQIALREYNIQTSNTIDIVEYGTYTSKPGEVSTEISLAFASGNIPDIIIGDAENVPLSTIANEGYLEDLNNFIQSDENFHEDEYYQQILRLGEDGELFYVTDSFSMEGFIGPSEFLHSSDRWSIDGFTEKMYELETERIPVVDSASALFNQLYTANADVLFDLSKKESYFNKTDFVELLNTAKRFGMSEESVQNIDYSQMIELSQNQGIAVLYMRLDSFTRYATQILAWSEAASFLGIPSLQEDRVINFQPWKLYGITKTSNKKEEAWEFISILLDREAQIARADNLFPVRRDVMEQHIQDAAIRLKNENLPLIDEMTENFINHFENDRFSVLNNSTIYQIVQEEVQPFFANQKTAEQVVAIIQDRVQTHLNERA